MEQPTPEQLISLGALTATDSSTVGELKAAAKSCGFNLSLTVIPTTYEVTAIPLEFKAIEMLSNRAAVNVPGDRISVPLNPSQYTSLLMASEDSNCVVPLWFRELVTKAI